VPGRHEDRVQLGGVPERVVGEGGVVVAGVERQVQPVADPAAGAVT
jgi:hypothetical protein